MAHGHTPQLPEVFPQGNVRVEDEKHRYETFAESSGTTVEQTEYTLNKAPIYEIEKVTGVSNGSTTEFSNGTDYQLVDLVREKEDSFTFNDTQRDYILQDGPDGGSTVIADESGDTYTSGVDYALSDTNDYESNGTIEWLTTGSTPNDGEDFTVEYTVTYSDSVIKWDPTETTPDASSFFYVTYRSESIISRYVASGDEQLGKLEHELTASIESVFVSQATGEELDELGELFGILGKRSGRNDDQYRIYLKSIVQSFISRGTINGIKLAISAATEVPLDDITITEDFEDSEYQVEVIPNTPVRGGLLEEIADIADPSGVNQSGTTFTIEPEETAIDDIVSFTEGQQIFEDALSADTVANFGFGTEGAAFENIFFDDAVLINPNLFSAADEMGVDDANTINGNKFSSTDQMGSADTAQTNRANTSDVATIQEGIATDTNKVSWDETNWDEFNWATENN